MIDEKRAFRDWPASCATQFIEDFEGRRLVAYRCSAGVWTIGVGHTGPEVHEGLTISFPMLRRTSGLRQTSGKSQMTCLGTSITT